jgi:hypothetical protein
VADGCDPLSPDEFLLRRIPEIYVDKSLPCPISLDHFIPHKNDTDGLSFFRESMRTSKSLIAEAMGKGRYYVAKAMVKEIADLGLAMNISKTDLSHLSLPDLTPQTIRDDNEGTTVKRDSLAQLMSKRIVLGPITSAEAKLP